MKKVYKVGLKCTNCKHVPKERIANPSAGVGGTIPGPNPAEFLIPYGVSVEQFFELTPGKPGFICTHCGCVGFMIILEKDD